MAPERSHNIVTVNFLLSFRAQGDHPQTRMIPRSRETCFFPLRPPQGGGRNFARNSKRLFAIELWQAQTEPPEQESSQHYDPNCYLCPGNTRARGARNPSYTQTFVFDNDFAALQPNTPPSEVDIEGKGIVVAQSESGICRVVCFSPRHNLTLSQMSPLEIRALVGTWIDQFETLSRTPDINYVQIFENRGSMMGCSNPHPHGQIWATSTIPNEPRKEQEALAAYRKQHGTCLLCDYIRIEESSGDRFVCGNELFLAVVPFWAVWPYEILVLSKRHVADIGALDEKERSALADILKSITSRYDSLFQ